MKPPRIWRHPGKENKSANRGGNNEGAAMSGAPGSGRARSTERCSRTSPCTHACRRATRRAGAIPAAPDEEGMARRSVPYYERLRRLRQDPRVGYAVVLASVALSIAARWAIGDLLIAVPFITFYPSVIISALIGGAGPGVAATSCPPWQPGICSSRPAFFPRFW